MGKDDAILVINAGSSSVKFSVYADRGQLALVARGQMGGLFVAPTFKAKLSPEGPAIERQFPGDSFGHDRALSEIVSWLQATFGDSYRLVAAGHRVAHGGKDYTQPVQVDASLLARLAQLVWIAPLHLPPNLAAIRALLDRAPQLPQVACFDTGMHRSLPRLEQMFALPREYEEAGVRRYGLHGLSYEYIAMMLPKFDERAARGKTVVLHLGSGASMCALDDGRSVGTTMGFTGVDGLPMGTRSGSLDPGVLLYLMRERGMDAQAIEDLIYTKSGLLGVSAVSNDMSVLLRSPEPRAALAVDLFVYRIARELGALTAILGGLDALVFTAGIGEHAAPVRERVCQRAAWLGVDLDPEANATHGPRITRPRSRTSAWVIPTNEELMIARHTRDVLKR
jgi:acetate kinase